MRSALFRLAVSAPSRANARGNTLQIRTFFSVNGKSQMSKISPTARLLQRRSLASRVYEGEVVTESPFTSKQYKEMPSDAKLKYTLLAGAAAVGLGTILFSGSKSTTAAEADAAAKAFPTRVRERLASSYGYFGLCIGTTAVVASLAARSPVLLTLAATRPMLFGIGSMVGVFGTMIATRMISYHDSPNLKRLSLLAFAGFQGVTLLPIVFVGGAIVAQAAMATGVMVGSLALLASVAPSESFLWMRGPLVIGLGVCFAASMGSMFFPASNLLYNVSLYGGMALFGGFTLYDVQRMISKAQMLPDEHYDPVNECIHLYMNTINIFIRFVQIFSNQNGNNRRR